MDNCVKVIHIFIMERLALMIYFLFYARGLCIVLVQLFIAWEFTFTITGAISSACSIHYYTINIDLACTAIYPSLRLCLAFNCLAMLQQHSTDIQVSAG